MEIIFNTFGRIAYMSYLCALGRKEHMFHIEYLYSYITLVIPYRCQYWACLGVPREIGQ